MYRAAKIVIVLIVISFSTSLKTLADTGPIWPEDPLMQATLLLQSPISPDNTIIQDAISSEYQQGIKHYLSLGVGELIGSAAILIDLDDYYGISTEGQLEGGEWVTVYIRGGFDLHISVLPVTVAYIVREGVNLNSADPTDASAADPYFDPQYFWGVGSVVGYEFQLFNNVPNEGASIDTDQLSFDIGFEFAKALYTLGPLEFKKQVVEAWFKDMLSPINGSIPGQAVGTLVGGNIISQIFNFNPDGLLLRFPTANDGVPSPPSTPADFEPAGVFFDTVMPVQLGTIFNVDLRIKNNGLAEGTGELLVYLVDGDEIVEIVYDSKEISPITLDAESQTSLSFPLDTSSLLPGEYVLKAQIYNVTPSEASTNNNLLCWGFHITANPTGSIDSILPNPATQGTDTIVFTGSGSDPDNRGTPPEICTYRWTSDLGRIDGQNELYNGTEPSSSIPASDLREGAHNISLTVQDNEGDWSGAVTDVLMINQAQPAEGHDVAANLYVNQSTVIHLPTENVSGEIWASNLGDYSESGTLLVQLKNSSESVLDSENYTFSSLGQGQSTSHHSFSLNPGGYQGDATVQAQVTVEHDSDLSNNQVSVPVYFSENLNPTDSFDGFEMLFLQDGETQNIRGHTFTYENAQLYVDGEFFSLSDDYVLLPFVVFRYCCFDIEAQKQRFDLWWPDNLYEFSIRDLAKPCYLTIPWGGTASFEISRASSVWPNVSDYDVEFISGLLPGSWSSSITPQGSKMIVEIQAAHGSGASDFLGWAHLHKSNGGIGSYSDAFIWMRIQAVSSPPETSIISGPEGIISTDDLTFIWSGSDDTTPIGQLQYAYRLESLEPLFSSFSTDTEKTYNGLEDGEYTFFVKARDLGGTEDSTPASRIFIIATNRIPDLPINQFPLSGQAGLSVTPTLVGSEFSDPDNGDTFAKSRFQIRLDTGTYDTPQWDSGELSPGTINIQVTQELTFDSTYWWRCQYQDDKGSWSPWSNETSFRTKVDMLKANDFNKDGKIDFGDFAIIASFWMQPCSEPNWCENCDLDKSSLVDTKDLRLFSENWLKQYSYSYTVENLTQLTNGTLHETEGNFNTQGTEIVYRNFHVPYSWDNCNIWVMNIDGSNKIQITTDSRGEFAPSFLPNGKITYTREVGSTDYDIWMVDGDGSNPQSFIDGAYRQSNPKWNQSGTKVVYMDEYQYQGPGEIWVADADGTGKTKLTDYTVDGYGQLYPVFSNSGNKIAYGNMATSNSPSNLWIMNADGSGKQQITNSPEAQYPMFWWPDDSQIGYIKSGKIWLHNLSTGTDEVLLEVTGASLGGWCDLSPDGSKLVFDRSDGSGTHIWIGDVVPQTE